jgi:hypothetical protein
MFVKINVGCEGLELHILHWPHMDSIDLDPPEMKIDLNEFYAYGDPSRLVPLLIEFANSIFVAWVISMPLNWIRGLIISKVNSRNKAGLLYRFECRAIFVQ